MTSYEAFVGIVLIILTLVLIIFRRTKQPNSPLTIYFSRPSDDPDAPVVLECNGLSFIVPVRIAKRGDRYVFVIHPTTSLYTYIAEMAGITNERSFTMYMSDLDDYGYPASVSIENISASMEVVHTYN